MSAALELAPSPVYEADNVDVFDLDNLPAGVSQDPFPASTVRTVTLTDGTNEKLYFLWRGDSSEGWGLNDGEQATLMDHPDLQRAAYNPELRASALEEATRRNEERLKRWRENAHKMAGWSGVMI